jgi:hypothetical protein
MMKNCQECSKEYEPTKMLRAYCSETCQKIKTKENNKKRLARFREESCTTQTPKTKNTNKRKKQRVDDLSAAAKKLIMNAKELKSETDKKARTLIAQGIYMEREKDFPRQDERSFWNQMEEHTGSFHHLHPTGVAWLPNSDYVVLENMIPEDDCTALLKQINIWDGGRTTRSNETAWVTVLEDDQKKQAGRTYYNMSFPENLLQSLNEHFINPLLLGHPRHKSWYVRAMKSHNTLEIPTMQQGNYYYYYTVYI